MMVDPGAVLPPLRQIIKEHGLSARKSLGQNFLLDEQLLDKIAAIPGNLQDRHVMEIGPGPGGLTRALLRAGAYVTAIERDERCLPILQDLGTAFPGKLNLISGDALRLRADQLPQKPYHIIANLPYNVGTQLYTGWMTSKRWPPDWSSLTLMFQREVAERITAKPGTSAYGRLSVLSQWRSKARLAMKVHRSAFTPPPQVMSAIVHVTPDEQPDNVDPQRLEQLTAAVFGQRRKMLRQSAKSVPGAIDAMVEAGIDPQRRAETISVDEFLAITRKLSVTQGIAARTRQ